MSNPNFLELYNQKLNETEAIRELLFKKSNFLKIFYYPPKISFSELLFRLIPNLQEKFLVENTLFWGDKFYTEGYFVEYYLCGFLAGDDNVRLTKFLIKNIKRDDIFFDVGANYGFFVLLAYKLITNFGNGGQEAASSFAVHAFEPAPSTYNVLSKNIFNKAIQINKFALSAHKGVTDFVILKDKKKNGCNSIYNYKDLVAGQTKSKKFQIIKVETETLDNYCFNNNIIPTILELDVEGSELDVISGGLNIIKSYKPRIIMEIWSKEYNEGHIKAAQMLISLGYNSHRIDKNGDLEQLSLEELRELPAADNIVFI